MKKRYLIIALIILSILSVFIGVKDISITNLFNLSHEEMQVLLLHRIPRLISIIIAGVGMSIAGLIMQQLTRNKFVSPTTAGTEDSAKLGILIALLLFSSAGTMVKMIIAFAFSLLGTFIFMKILDKIKFKDAIFIPLVGLMFGSVIASMSTFVGLKYDLIQNLSSWMLGDFSMILKGQYELLYLTVPLIIIAYLYAERFTVAGMGEDFSKNLGMNHKQIVNIGLVIVALITASVILTAGVIPFLGLIVPNIVTIYQGDHLKKSISLTALLGAVFLLFCDILGRILIFPYEIPISLTVGVIGSGVFIYLLMRRKAYE